MIDYVKIELFVEQPSFIKTLLANGYEVRGNFIYETGEAKDFPLIASNKNLEIIFKGENFVQLSGSIHKFAHDGFNHSDFYLNDILQTVLALIDTLSLNPLTSCFHNIEFGVNINPPFETKRFLKQVLSYCGTNFIPMKSKDGHSLGIECQLSHFRIKMYSKKSQYNLPVETMRFEIHVEKMQYLTGKKINMKVLKDLFVIENLIAMGKLLNKVYDEIVIFDKSIDAAGLSKPQRELYTTWSNPILVSELSESDVTKFQYQRRQWRKLQAEFSKEHHQQKAGKLIEEKVNQLLIADEKTSIILTDFQDRFLKPNFNQSYPSYKRADSLITPSPSRPILLSKPNQQIIEQREINKATKQDGKIGKELLAAVQKSEVGNNERKLIETSFLGTDGKFYIPNPKSPNRIAVYDSPEAYNKRLHIPEYIAREEAEQLFSKLLPVDLQTLQTVTPA